MRGNKRQDRSLHSKRQYNDIDRMPEIKERSPQYEGLKHYFLVKFAPTGPVL